MRKFSEFLLYFQRLDYSAGNKLSDQFLWRFCNFLSYGLHGKKEKYADKPSSPTRFDKSNKLAM